MHKTTTRRSFIRTTAAGLATAAAGSRLAGAQPESQAAEAQAAPRREYGISLAAWSLHKTIGRGENMVDMLEMPRMAREDFGIEAIELVSGQLSATDDAYFAKLKANAEAHNVKILLIMVDGQGDIGSDRERRREQAVERHQFWVDTAAGLGCHSIRMNWKGEPRGVMEDPALLQEFIDRSVPGFQALCEYGDTKNINILLENHWGPSSYPDAVERLAAAINHPRFGTLPDFGNFPEEVDRYDATDRLMRFAKAVSAKCYDFDPDTGEETQIDFERMIRIVVDTHGYNGYIGIEYEGSRMSEAEGIKAAKALLERCRG